MKKSTKKNLPLILGLSIPLGMIILVAAFIYIPAWIAPKPTTDFLYTTGDNNYYYSGQYTVQNGHLVKNEIPQDNLGMPKPIIPGDVKFYRYNTTNNEAKEISFGEAEQLGLNSNVVSPDGYEVTSANSGGEMLPFSSSPKDRNSKYLKGHNTAKKLNIHLPNDYYYNFKFLGWIK